MAGWVRKHVCAAFEKLFSRTISKKVCSWSKSTTTQQRRCFASRPGPPCVLPPGGRARKNPVPLGRRARLAFTVITIAPAFRVCPDPFQAHCLDWKMRSGEPGLARWCATSMWRVLLFQALDGLRIRSGGAVRPWREWNRTVSPTPLSCHMTHRRFWGVETEANGRAKECRSVSLSAVGRVKGSHWPGFDRTIVPTPRPRLTVIDGTGPRACARGYYPCPLPGAGSGFPIFVSHTTTTRTTPAETAVSEPMLY